ncbi:SigE family RNA polymerase sigma factor [Pseudofrankia sp. DC12]|uniref:SigE family RNA polymerase sigma factor n=1 Tax=Pseudofrankia sp. DC12 TaxID=683315 RepID=UPI000B0D4A8B|nr:SigE family RNA polymerase sigma factor [Pseudofrankia sp. DC12]
MYIDDVSLNELGGPRHGSASRSAARARSVNPSRVTATPSRPASRVFPPSGTTPGRAGTGALRPAAGPAQAEEFPEPPTADRHPAGAGGRPAQAEFERFFEAHHRELARFAYLLSGDRDAAEDITAEALTSAWVHWDRVQAADNPLAYVRRSVANLAAGRIRRTVRERNVLAKLGRQLPIQATNGPDVPAVLDLESALLRLPLRKRQCVILRHGLDLSEAETADTLGISIGTVKSQTSKAVSELERLLAAGGPGVPAANSAGASAAARKRPRIRRVALRGGEA